MLPVGSGRINWLSLFVRFNRNGYTPLELETQSVACRLMGSILRLKCMNLERTIAEIEWLEHLYALPDTRPPQLSDLYAANQRHDEMYADNPWFRLWKRYGV